MSKDKGLWWRLVIILLLLVGAWFSIQRITFREDILEMLPSDDPIVMDYRRTLKRFDILQRLLIDVHFSDLSANKQEPDKLIVFAEQLVAQMRKSRLFKSIDYRIELAQIQALRTHLWRHRWGLLSEQDRRLIEQKITPKNIKKTIAQLYAHLTSPSGLLLKKQLLEDPFAFRALLDKKLRFLGAGLAIQPYRGYWFSKDGKHLLIVAKPFLNSAQTGQLDGFIVKLEALIEKVSSKHRGISAYFIGGHRSTYDNSSQIKRDVFLTVSLSFIAILLLFFLVFRRPILLAIASLPPLFGGTMAVAMLGLWRQEMSAIPLAFGSVLLGISVDYAIHLCYHFEFGGTPLAKLVEKLKLILFMAAATTIAAFLCLLFARFRGQHAVGLFAAFGISFALFFTLFFIPALLARLGKTEREPHLSMLSFVAHLEGFRERYPRLILIGIFLLTVLTAFGLSRVAFEGDLEKLYALSPETKALEARFHRIWNDPQAVISIVVQGRDLEDAKRKNDRLFKRLISLKRRGFLAWISSISPLYPSQEEYDKRQRAWRQFWSKERLQDLESKMTFEGKRWHIRSRAFRRFFRSLRGQGISSSSRPTSHPSLSAGGRSVSSRKPLEGLFKQIVAQRIRREKGAVYILTLVKKSDNAPSLMALLRKGEKHLSILSSRDFVAHIMEIVKSDFERIAWIAFIVVILVIFFGFLHLDLVLTTLLPLIVATIWTLGLMGWLGLTFNLLNIVVSIFIFGLGVDYSLFFVKQTIEQNFSQGDEVSIAGASIVISALTTLFGMGSLVFAHHPLLLSIGYTSVIAIFSTLLVTFFLTPIIAQKVIRSGRYAKPISLKTVINTIIGLGWFFGWVFIIFLFSPLLRLWHRKNEKVPYYTRKLLRFLSYWMMKIVPFSHLEVVVRDELKEKPAIIVSNHRSMLDIAMTFLLPYDVRMLVKGWVWNAPVLGSLVRFSGMLPIDGVSKEGGSFIDKGKEALEEGSSILVFPEGTRAISLEMGKFHSGAFHLAIAAQADILPVFMFNTESAFRKGAIRGQDLVSLILVGPRISADDEDFYKNPRRLKKVVRQRLEEMNREAAQLAQEKWPEAMRLQVHRHYAYLGAYVEQYTYWKLRIDPFPTMIEPHIAAEAEIFDLGCGYGTLAHYLYWLSPKRRFLGIDYDAHKIDIARKSAFSIDNLTFEEGDLLSWQAPYRADYVLLVDILHYWEREEQESILINALNAVKEGGFLILRDGDPARQSTKLPVWSERFSTFFGFNKAKGHLHFRSMEEIQSFLEERGFDVRRLEDPLSEVTGNITLIAERVHLSEKGKKGE